MSGSDFYQVLPQICSRRGYRVKLASPSHCCKVSAEASPSRSVLDATTVAGRAKDFGLSRCSAS
eukprot:6469015-Amphidinium_carterae.2